MNERESNSRHVVQRYDSPRYSGNTGMRGYNASRKRRRKIRAFYIIAFCVVAITAAAVLAGLTLKVSDIIVIGSSIYSQEEIKQACSIQPGDSLLSADTDYAESFVSQSLPYIGTIKVEKKFPSKIVVEVEAAKELCYVHQGSYGILVSDQYKILSVNSFAETEHLLIEGITLFTPEAGFSMNFKNVEMQGVFSAVMDGLQKTEFPMGKISVLSFEDLNNISFMYDKRIQVNLGTADNLEYKIAFAKKMLENSSGEGIAENAEGTLDLSRASDTDKAVFSLKTENKSSAPTENESISENDSEPENEAESISEDESVAEDENIAEDENVADE